MKNELTSAAHFSPGTYRGWILLFLFSVIALEIIISWRKDLHNYSVKETFSNLIILAGLQLSKFIFAGYQLWLLMFFYRFAPIHWNTGVVEFIAAFILIDFMFYWYHRISHKVKFFWAFHLVHHSSPWMNLTTAYRLNWLGGLVSPVFFIPAILIGLSPNTVAVCIAFNLIYQFFLHTELIPPLGWIENIFNTPSNHRVHHGSNPIYIDRNFGGFLIVWDKLFGTYQPETVKPVYGITTGFIGHNPFTAVFHGFMELFKGRMQSKG